MNDSNKKKNELLGEPYGTANGKLRKMIIFDFVKKLGLDNCYRCGEKIETIDTLSIEHKDNWMSAENPKESFYNLENISFSHLSCNCSAANRPTGVRIGTPHGITRFINGCRCEVCSTIYREDCHNRNVTEQRKKYNREYQKARYNSEKDFRENNIKKSIEYYHKNKNAPISG